jgi:hypothetical protein
MGLTYIKLNIANPARPTSLGTLSLASLGMMLDPLKRELRPLPMLLASDTPN